MSLGRFTTLCLQESCQSYVLNISGLTRFCPVKQQSHEGTNRERVTRRACSGVEGRSTYRLGVQPKRFSCELSCAMGRASCGSAVESSAQGPHARLANAHRHQQPVENRL